MSVDKIIQEFKEDKRSAAGMFKDCLTTVQLSRAEFSIFNRWKVFVNMIGIGYDSKGFWRRKSADKYFESLLSKYKLKEEYLERKKSAQPDKEPEWMIGFEQADVGFILPFTIVNYLNYFNYTLLRYRPEITALEGFYGYAMIAENRRKRMIEEKLQEGLKP